MRTQVFKTSLKGNNHEKDHSGSNDVGSFRTGYG